MSHSYDKTANCQCSRCVKERSRRAAQSAAMPVTSPQFKGAVRTALKRASRAEQRARYIDCGPGAWDDK